MLNAHESFFCFYSILVPSWSLTCGGGLHVSVRSSLLYVPLYAFSFLPCIWAGMDSGGTRGKEDVVSRTEEVYNYVRWHGARLQGRVA